MQGRDFLHVARFLDGQDSQEYHRTQIGRYYYAAFLEARSFCEQRFGFERTWQSQEHRRVPQLISTIDQELADNLAFLRKYRNAADYDLELSRETASIQAAQSAAIAVRIIARLDALTVGNRQS